MFQRFGLSKKFNLIVLLVFVGGFVLTGGFFAATLMANAKGQVVTNALMLLQTMNSVRDYTSTQVNPELAPRLETDAEFIPQTVPGYSAREVFENLRKSPDYSDFFYKEATLNPTNLRDKSDPFETSLIERFQKQPDLKELNDFRSITGGDLFYIARPIIIKKESCLRCHSTPEAAPKSMIATYGSENGFGWKLNDVVGAQVLSVPANQVFRSAYQAFFLLMTISFGIFTIALVLINILLHRSVIRPLNRMVAVADQVSKGQMENDFEQTTEDEIGTLASAFNRMKLSLTMAMKMLNQSGTQS